MNFEEAYNQYMLYVDVKQKNQSKRSLKEVFKNHILPYWKDFNIYDITANDFILWQQRILTNDYKYSYLKKIYYCFSGFLEYCINFHDLKYNVAKKVGCFKKSLESKIIHNFYTPKEFSKFINKVSDKVYKSFFRFMYLTGVRPGEAMALKFKDISFCNIDINSSIEEHCDVDKKERLIGLPKTLSSIRNIKIDIILYIQLISLKKYYLKKFGSFNENYFVFGGVKPLAPTSIRRQIKKASELANIHYIKPHEFRHSHASFLYNKNIPVTEISVRLGHSTPSTTLNTYIHSYNNQEKRLIKVLSLTRIFHIF